MLISLNTKKAVECEGGFFLVKIEDLGINYMECISLIQGVVSLNDEWNSSILVSPVYGRNGGVSENYIMVIGDFDYCFSFNDSILLSNLCRKNHFSINHVESFTNSKDAVTVATQCVFSPRSLKKVKLKVI